MPPANRPSSTEAVTDPARPTSIAQDTERPSPQSQPSREKPDDASPRPWLESSPGKLAAALLFGVIFGFLLQKGGVAKFDILIGVLLLEKFVVVQVMLTAIIVGMVGVFALRRAGVIEPKMSDTVYGANAIGGLIFGVGFALLAYCPGTTAAAVGQGNLDALVGVAGMLFGSYLFALSSGFTGRTVSRWGRRGKLTWPELLNVPAGVFVAVAVPLMVGVLALLELFAE